MTGRNVDTLLNLKEKEGNPQMPETKIQQLEGWLKGRCAEQARCGEQGGLCKDPGGQELAFEYPYTGRPQVWVARGAKMLGHCPCMQRDHTEGSSG